MQSNICYVSVRYNVDSGDINESLNRLVQTLTTEMLIANNISKFTLQNFGGRGKC